MKTNLTLALFLMLAPLLLKAQAGSEEMVQNRIKVGYGDASYVTFTTALYGSLVLGSGDVSTSGSWSVGYRRLTNNSRWALGGDFNYTGVKEKFDNGSKISYNMFAIIPTAEYYYMKSGICRLYGTAGVGPMFNDDGSVGAAFQVSPIAARVGNNQIAGFVELGVGYKGIVNFGLEIGF